MGKKEEGEVGKEDVLVLFLIPAQSHFVKAPWSETTASAVPRAPPTGIKQAFGVT